MFTRRGLLGTATAALVSSQASSWPRHGTSVFSNFTGSNLATWQTGQAAVLAGTRNAQILCMGDSITMGTGSNNDLHINALDNGYPAQLGGGLLAHASWQSMMANNALGPIIEVAPCDFRLGIAGNWILADQCFAGNIFASQAAGIFSFTPATPVDTFTIYYPKTSGAGRFTIALDGGSTLQTIDTSSVTDLLGSVTQTTSLGSHTIDIQWDSGGTGGFIFITQITAYDSTSKQILVLNAGAQGTRADQWTVSGPPWYYQQREASIAADLTIIMAGTNDWIQGTSLATFTSSLQTVITIALSVGSCILMADPPTNSTVVPYSTQATYVAAIKALAISNGIPFINNWSLFGSDWSIANSRGWIFNDEHPNGLGYTQIANVVNKALAPGFISL